MAKLTGQFTTPSLDANNNKINKPFLKGVVFVFQGATKVTRESDDKGKYSFDLANGEYDVSVYLKGNTEKDRFDMRPGEKFVVTSTIKADALDKWLQVIGDGGKDELAAYYENLLAQMQAVYDKFRDETKADGTGLFVKQSSVKKNSLKDYGTYYTNQLPPPILESGMHGLSSIEALKINNPGLDFSGLNISDSFLHFYIQQNYTGDNLIAFFTGYRTSVFLISIKNGGAWSKPVQFMSNESTLYDSNGVARQDLKGATSLVAGSYGFATKNRHPFHDLGAGTLTQFFNLGIGDKAPSEWGTTSAGGWVAQRDGRPIAFYFGNRHELKISRFNGANWSIPDEFLSTANTTVDSNGNIKAASPIVKLFANKIEHSGFGDEKPIFEKLDTGVYKIGNTLGLAKGEYDGDWYIETPKDKNGDVLFNIEWSQDEDNNVIIRTYKRREIYKIVEDEEGNIMFGEKRGILNGDPVDINDGRFVSLRFYEDPEVLESEMARQEAEMLAEE